MTTCLPFVALLAAAAVLGACAAPHAQPRDTAALPPPAPPLRTGVVFDTVTVGGATRPYAVYIPRSYDPAKPMPVVVFLNGSGECGTDGQRQLTQGLFPAMINDPQRWNMIAVFPQKPTRQTQWSDHDDYVMACLRAVQAGWHTDPDRVYLTGLSQGGAGTWSIAANHPTEFAAIAPVCGYGDPGKLAIRLGSVPIWAFHGAKDDVVTPNKTTAIADAITAAGGNPKVTIYPDLNHGCWDRAYRDAGLAEWFLQHQRVK